MLSYWQERYKEITKSNWEEDALKYIVWLEQNLYTIKRLVIGPCKSATVLKLIKEALVKGE